MVQINAMHQEDEAIRSLRMNGVYSLSIGSLGINGKYYLYERRKLNISAIGEGEHEHLYFLEEPLSRRVFSHSLEARNLRLEGNIIMEKEPFNELDFGNTHYSKDVSGDYNLIMNAIRAFKENKK